MTILTIIVPIFLIIGIGYGSRHYGLFKAEDLRALSKFVITFALPALIFHAVAGKKLNEILRLDYLGTYTVASLATFGIGFAQARWFRKTPVTDAALQGMGSAMSNSAYFGFPIASQFLGSEAILALGLNQVIENLVMFPLSLTLAEAGAGFKASGSRGYGSFWRVLALRLIKNPIIIAILAGIATSALQIPIPAVLDKAVTLLASASPACALFIIGGSLIGAFQAENIPDISFVAFGKLFIHPALMALAMLAVPAMEPSLRKAAILYAAMPMLSIYPLIGQSYNRQALCAATLTVTVVISFFSISALAYLMFG